LTQRNEISAVLAMRLLNGGGSRAPPFFDLGTQSRALSLELKDLLHSRQVQALVRELLDPAQSFDVVLAVAAAAASRTGWGH
jgi:hypothetical protein